MPAEAPVLSPELRTGTELPGGDDSLARSALTLSVRAVVVGFVFDARTVEPASEDADEVAEERTEELVNSAVDVLVEGDADCLCIDDADELLVDAVVSGDCAYPLTVVNPTKSLVVTVPPAI